MSRYKDIDLCTKIIKKEFRCKWCKDETPNADDFCSYGERKDKE